MKQMITVSVPLSTNLETEARVIAAGMGISRSELIRRAIKDYLPQLAVPSAIAAIVNRGEDVETATGPARPGQSQEAQLEQAKT